MSTVAPAAPALAAESALTPARTSVAAECPGCAAPLGGPFCAQCGQRAEAPRLTLRAFASEIVAQVAQLDHGLLHTFVQLVRRPGPTIRDYIGGQRRKYTSPVSYALLAVGFAVLRGELIGRARSLEAVVTKAAAGKAAFSVSQQASMARIFGFLDAHRTLFLVAALVPVIALLRGLFENRRYNVAEITTFAGYAVGTATILKLLIALPFDLIPALPFRPQPGIVLVAYVIWAGLDFFGRSFDTLWRFVVAVGGGVIAFFFVTMFFLAAF